MEGHLLDLGPCILQQHHGHQAALGQGVVPGHSPVQQVLVVLGTVHVVPCNSAGDGEQGREMRTLIQVDNQGNVILLTQVRSE